MPLCITLVAAILSHSPHNLYKFHLRKIKKSSPAAKTKIILLPSRVWSSIVKNTRSGLSEHRSKSDCSQARSKTPHTPQPQHFCWRTFSRHPLFFHFYTNSLIFRDAERKLLEAGGGCWALSQFPALKTECNASLAQLGWARAPQLLPRVRHPKKPAKNWAALFFSSVQQPDYKRKKGKWCHKPLLRKSRETPQTKLALRSSPASQVSQSHASV